MNSEKTALRFQVTQNASALLTSLSQTARASPRDAEKSLRLTTKLPERCERGGPDSWGNTARSPSAPGKAALGMRILRAPRPFCQVASATNMRHPCASRSGGCSRQRPA